MESFLPLIELILPEFIIDNYLLTHVEKSEERYHVYLEEKNYPADDDPRKADLLSKGYFPSITLQNFPIRGHKVFLHIKRRRWLNRAANRTKTGKVEYRDWSEVGEGTRMTSEFAAFLPERRPKEIGGYQG
ncbi:transposase [Dyadobacter sp. CY312]|uniref:ISAon1 family transposase N-terminal region protein n=1 Tax=Dyadobacter sp. CY312 TaxID=2907303 RepID=UPI001F175E55|nr:transposase [Dyadobacter sp. CY312]MCE7043963.1 transposase [Dyadobacter sp. CY312]